LYPLEELSGIQPEQDGPQPEELPAFTFFMALLLNTCPALNNSFIFFPDLFRLSVCCTIHDKSQWDEYSDEISA